MASSRGSVGRWNRAAEQYRTMNLALLLLRKAPKRIRVHHGATMTPLTRRS